MTGAPGLQVRGLTVRYGEAVALRDLSMDFPAGAITALVGPSGCGKSTLLGSLNAMVDTVRGARREGEVRIGGQPASRRKGDLARLRRRFGVVAQTPNPFPRSVRENVAYGPRLHRLARDPDRLDAIVRRCLTRVGLWEELSGELDVRATELSVGQQHRLCFARALAYEPEIFLVDEPVASLDPVAAARMEALIASLRRGHTVVLATHHLDLAARIADHVGCLAEGRLVRAGAPGAVLTGAGPRGAGPPGQR